MWAELFVCSAQRSAQTASDLETVYCQVQKVNLEFVLVSGLNR